MQTILPRWHACVASCQVDRNQSGKKLSDFWWQDTNWNVTWNVPSHIHTFLKGCKSRYVCQHGEPMMYFIYLYKFIFCLYTSALILHSANPRCLGKDVMILHQTNSPGRCGRGANLSRSYDASHGLAERKNLWWQYCLGGRWHLGPWDYATWQAFKNQPKNQRSKINKNPTDLHWETLRVDGLMEKKRKKNTLGPVDFSFQDVKVLQDSKVLVVDQGCPNNGEVTSKRPCLLHGRTFIDGWRKKMLAHFWGNNFRSDVLRPQFDTDFSGCAHDHIRSYLTSSSQSDGPKGKCQFTKFRSSRARVNLKI